MFSRASLAGFSERNWRLASRSNILETVKSDMPSVPKMREWVESAREEAIAQAGLRGMLMISKDSDHSEVV